MKTYELFRTIPWGCATLGERNSPSAYQDPLDRLGARCRMLVETAEARLRKSETALPALRKVADCGGLPPSGRADGSG